MHNLLYGNTSTIKMILGRGNNGHIGIFMRDTLYTTIFPRPYVAPVDPLGKETVHDQATTPQHSQLQDKHSKECCIHGNHHEMDASLKEMVLNAVDNTHMFSLYKVFT